MKMERVLDQQGRWRNKVVAFRMSPEEDEVLEAKVKLSGLTKQEYIIRREPFPKKWTRKMRKKQNEANRSE